LHTYDRLYSLNKAREPSCPITAAQQNASKAASVSTSQPLTSKQRKGSDYQNITKTLPLWGILGLDGREWGQTPESGIQQKMLRYSVQVE
jgi:hypothetical protein